MRLPSRFVSSFLIALVIVNGCSKQPETPPVPAVTIENLKVAHACAFKRSLWYTAAASAAESERLGNLAMMLRAVSRSEAIHASLHEQLLSSKGVSTDTSKASCLPLGSTRQALKMGVSLERTQFEGLYPPMVAAAVKEDWPEAAEQFRRAVTVDSGHFTYLKEASDRNGTVPMRAYRVCGGCGFLSTGSEASCVVCASTAFEAV